VAKVAPSIRGLAEVKRGRGAHHSDAFTVVRIDAEETLVGELAVGRSEQLVVRGGTPR
jgi:hypothetical protein